jgi:hypothetical protein
MAKFLFLSILALTLAITPDNAQQTRTRALVRERVAAGAPAAADQQNSSLDDTMKWLQRRLPAPFEVNVKAGGHFDETVSYSTVLVDWKGCSAHFRSEREHTFNGEIDKHTVDQIIPLGDVDPSRIQPYPLQVPGLVWDVPGISVSTAYERRTIIDTFQSPSRNTYYTNITFSDPFGDSEPRVIAALQHAVQVCGGRPETF